MRKVAVVTASRADWGNYYPLIQAIKASPELRLAVIAWNGYSYIPDAPPCQYEGESDIVIVSGDTMPMLQAAIQATEHRIPIVHLGGGDATTGACVDEQIRHAITRLAHLHFPQTQASAERLIRMGEEAWRVQCAGPLGIYAMPDAAFIPEQELRRQLGLSEKPIVIVIQHPVSSQVEQTGEQMRVTLEAVSQIPDIQPVIIYPNGEAGGVEMIRVIQRYIAFLDDWRAFNNLPFLTFQSLLKVAAVIVGNSSCAIVEAPFYGVPAVNVGIRQEGREHGENIYDVGHSVGKIKLAIGLIIFGQPLPTVYRISPFQTVPGGIDMIIKALVETPIDDRLMRKRLSF